LALLKELSDNCVRNLYEGAYAAVRAGKGKSLRQAFLERVSIMKDWGFEKQRECANRTLEVYGSQLSKLYLKSLELYLTQVLIREKRACGKIVASGVPPFEAFLHHFYCKLLDTQEVRELSYQSAGVLDRMALVQDCLLRTFYDYVPCLNVTQVSDSTSSPRSFRSPSSGGSPRWDGSPIFEGREEPLADMFSPRMARFPPSHRPTLPRDRIPSISTVLPAKQPSVGTKSPSEQPVPPLEVRQSVTERRSSAPRIDENANPSDPTKPSQPPEGVPENSLPSHFLRKLPAETASQKPSSSQQPAASRGPVSQPRLESQSQKPPSQIGSSKAIPPPVVPPTGIETTIPVARASTGSRAFVKAAEIVVAAPTDAET
jgi:hypothetical protein